ncbi:MAG: DsbA family protein [Alphaproteobacteria bacterium]|nr:DsbA family protein [Alphaproteobacteria bacterium]
MPLLLFRSAAVAAATLITLVTLIGRPIAAVAADDFTPDQRRAIEAIVKDYLAKNPDVLLDALQAAEDKIKAEAHDKAAAALVTQRQALLDDPQSPVAGNPNGDVSVVEFFDYRCPYCKQVEPSLETLLGQDHQLRFVYKEFPVLGSESKVAARAALASRKQGKYDAVHRALMALKGQIDDSAIMKTAASVGVDVERLKQDMKSPDIDSEIKATYDLADALDIHGTPGFVIGNEVVPGAISIEDMKQLIDTARHK